MRTQLSPSNSKNNLLQHWPAGLILLGFVVLATIYSLATPPLEAGDESRHYAVVKFMADSASLPVQQPGPAQIHWSHEGNQPPLYYALAALLTGWIETGDWDDVFQYNPHTTIGNPLRPDNKNITIHVPGESITTSGSVLAIHLARFLSISMATVTVIGCYLIALRLFLRHRWLAAGAMSITAFNPMFIFISAAVNNDNAIIMFVTLALLLLCRPDDQVRHPLRYAALVGLVIGLAALSKLYAFGLLPLAVGRLLWLARTKKQRQSLARPASFWKHGFIWAGTMLVLFLTVAGWFYARNAVIYDGDLFALQVMRETAGQRDQIPTLTTVLAEFEGFRIAYWALFGGVNILADRWIYTLLDWVSLVAFIGLLAFIVLWLYERKDSLISTDPVSVSSASSSLPRRELAASQVATLPFLLLLSWTLIMATGFIAWNITQPAGQGRLMYPAIAAISALGLLGLIWWLPTRGKTVVASACAILLFIFAAAAPFRYILPAYAAPPLVMVDQLPADVKRIDYTYADTVQLIGYRLPRDTVRAAETVPITLYWQLVRPTDQNYSVFIHLLGRQRRVIGQLDSYPGGGKWPTTLLDPGDVVVDTYQVAVSPEAEFTDAPARVLIAVGIYDYDEPGRPGKPTVSATGEPVEPIIAAVKLIPWRWPEPVQTDSPVNFFDKITLLGYRFDDKNEAVTFFWQANTPLDTDYTVFIQAWDTDTNQYAAGFDAPPRQGDYPTSYWEAGEIIADTHAIDLSQLQSGSYNFLVGLYDPVTGERLPAFGPDGPLADYAVNLGQVTVKETNPK